MTPIKDDTFRSPLNRELFFSLESREIARVQSALDAGANPNTINQGNSCTALDTALFLRFDAAVDLLIPLAQRRSTPYRGGRWSIVDRDPLFSAIQTGNNRALEKLIEHEIILRDIFTEIKDKLAIALRIAVSSEVQNVEAVRILLKNGIDLSRTLDHNRHSAFEQCKDTMQFEGKKDKAEQMCKLILESMNITQSVSEVDIPSFREKVQAHRATRSSDPKDSPIPQSPTAGRW